MLSIIKNAAFYNGVCNIFQYKLSKILHSTKALDQAKPEMTDQNTDWFQFFDDK